MSNRIHETIAFGGKIGEIIHTTQPDGRVFERYRRPPGTRLVIVSPDKKILVTKEHRHEADGVDLRLPGGKVRDTLQSYQELLASGRDMVEAAAEAAAQEALQETGFIIRHPQLITRANAGATVEWDLYYFSVEDYEQSPGSQELEHGEDIEVTWMTPAELREAIGKGQMQEWRSAGVLLGLVLPKLEKADQ
jgi:8-oxo-dGTP pyrophosphatase MutT (NUDIX family)